MGKKGGEFICATCQYRGRLIQETKGSFIIELALWLFFIFPGLLYSLWRLSTRHNACPKCHGVTMIPLDTPKGQELAVK